VVWDLGHYEHVAVELLPVAEVAVALLNPTAGEFVVDVGCGTGNAALLAASRGATVLGVDPSPRLLSVARESAEGRDLDVRFASGEASALPVDDGSVDAIVSVFALIFASEPLAAAAEAARALRSEGRIVLTAWKPGGALAQIVRERRELVAEVQGSAAPPSAPFEWHESDALNGLFRPYGFDVQVSEGAIAFQADSAKAYMDFELENSPRWVEARSILEPAGRWSELRQSATKAYNDANEDPHRFRLTSHYVVAVGRRTTGSHPLVHGI
jgi:SAM-dependent methyltransferase